MRNSLWVGLIVVVGLLSGSMAFFGETDPWTDASGVVVEKVNANLVRVRVNGRWEEFPLMPLADHLCQGKKRMFERYCPDAPFRPFSN